MEFSELGSGFRLALRDLEIRGAGNVLSAEQHGFAKEIGFELYSRLIEEASQNLAGEKPKEEFKTTLDFIIPAHIPADYVQAEEIRVMFYRKLALAKSDEDLAKIKTELTDRFGKIPSPAENLFELSDLKLQAEGKKIKSLVEDEKYISIFFSDEAEVSQNKIIEIAGRFKDQIEFLRGDKKGLKIVKSKIEKEYFPFLRKFISALFE